MSHIVSNVVANSVDMSLGLFDDLRLASTRPTDVQRHIAACA